MPRSSSHGSSEGETKDLERPQTDDPDVAGEEKEAEPDWYCPGCGTRYAYQQKCTGKPESPHPPIEVVPTGELEGDPEHHTAAPSTENLG